MTPPPEELRLAALEVLDGFGDARAARILETAHIEIASGVAWEGTDGTIRGQRVRLGVDGAGLAHMLRVPAVADAVTAALAYAISATRGHALVDLEAHWALRSAPEVVGYRTNARAGPGVAAAADVAEHVEEAALAFIEASRAAGAPASRDEAIATLLRSRKV